MEEQKEKKWYIVQTYSGKENIVKENLTQRIKSLDMTDLIFQVVVPEEIVQEQQANGTIKEKVQKKFPGYVFVEMIDNEDSWWVVRNTPSVTGFLGSAGKKTRPVPVSDEEMKPILEQCGLVAKPEVNYAVGDKVTIINGSYKDSSGPVEEIDFDNGTVTVTIEFLSRPVAVTVGIYDVQK